MKIEEIMNIMNDIEYGFKDDKGNNIIETDIEKWDNEFDKFYFLQTPEELLDSKCGVCWEQVELERKMFKDAGYDIKTYFIYSYNVENNQAPSHTFLVYEKDTKYYWFEHSWFDYKGIHEYDKLKNLLLDIKSKFLKSNNLNEDAYTFLYEYDAPPKHIKCWPFYDYIETQKLIKLNEPLYFYHVVNKNADMSEGLISLKYMYDHNMFDLFDKYTDKYKERIVSSWNIPKYKGRDEKSLSREEIMDALNTFRGPYGTSYIYFFRYPLYEEMGNRIKELLKEKDIYRINIRDEEVEKHIKDIFYGYEGSMSDNKMLDLNYYKNVTKEEYFSKYDNDEKMNFKNLNHISIAFTENYCPLKFLEKYDQK